MGPECKIYYSSGERKNFLFVMLVIQNSSSELSYTNCNDIAIKYLGKQMLYECTPESKPEKAETCTF